MNWPGSTIVKEGRSFLSIVGYYRRFVEDFFKLVVPITQLTCKNTKLEWSKECEHSF